MSSQYPGGYDNLSARTDASPATPDAHAADHTAERDAINAIQTELGLDPAGASATVKARLDALDTTVAGKENTGVAAALVDDLSGVTNASAARGNLGLGTAAVKDAPAIGNASTSQVVLGSDTRLTDARTPSSTLSHASTHGSAGSDPISIANTQVSGLGTMSTQSASNVAITGGSVTGITDLAVADGGTGASDSSTARSNLGVYSTSQVDSLVNATAANVGKRARVRVATTANVTISTALTNGQTLDGVVLATNDLVLVKNQTTTGENGVYVVQASPARFSEFDTYDEHPGSLIAVQEGTTNADTLWLCTSNTGGTLGTTAIAFVKMVVAGELLATNNLSDVASSTTARTNLGLGTSATLNVPAAGDAAVGEVVKGNDSRLTDSRTPSLHASSHGSAGSDPISIANTQVTGLGDSATKNVGTTAGTVAAGDDSRITGAAQKANNLSDLANAGTARTNLGLGSSAVKDIPAIGNATTSQIVFGTDTRLTDARTPLAHASSHAAAGADPLTLGVAQITGAEATANKGVANGYASLDATGKVPSAQLPSSSSAVTSVDGLTGAVSLSSSYQPLDSDLTAVAGLSTNGLIARTATGTAATRTVTGGTGLTVTNGDGVSGNPTLALNQNLQDIAGITRSQGDLITGGASSYTNLARGTQFQFLQAGASSLQWAFTPRVVYYDAGKTVSSTTSATSLVNSTLSTPTLAAGDVLHLRASGVVLNSTGASATMTFTLLWGATTLMTQTSASLVSSTSVRPWTLDLTLTVKTVAASGTLVSNGTLALTNATTSAQQIETTSTAHMFFQAYQATVATNSAQTVNLQATPSASNANLQCTLYAMTVTHLPKM